MKVRVLFICLILICFISKASIAQILYPLKNKETSISAYTGLFRKQEIFELGVSRGVLVKIWKFKETITFFLEGEDRTRFSHPNALKFTYGALANLYSYRNFKIPFRKTFDVQTIDRGNGGSSANLGASFELMPGFYKNNKFIALDLYYGDYFKGKESLTGGNVTDDFKHIFDGWIKPHQKTFRTGIQMGKRFNKNEFVVRANMQFFKRNGHSEPLITNLKGATVLIGYNRFLFKK